MIDDIPYYTLPCIAELVFPEPAKWKKSWETIYKSLMPHRDSIIQDQQRVRSVSELPDMHPPHGDPGSWTARSSTRSRGSSRSPWTRYPSNSLCSYTSVRSVGRTILFLFEPRRQLPGNRRSQSISPFFWAHNTNIHAAIAILKDEELIRPSKWLMQPPPNPEYTNWNQVWIPPMGFYCRGSLVSQEAAVKAAAQFAGVRSNRPICIGGAARLRQSHCSIPRGGTYADIAASHYCDCIHAKDGRWKLRSSIAVPSYVGMFW